MRVMQDAPVTYQNSPHQERRGVKVKKESEKSNSFQQIFFAKLEEQRGVDKK